MPNGSNYNVDKLKKIFEYCADAIREKTGTEDTYTPDQLADKIIELETVNVLDPHDQIFTRNANNQIVSARFGISVTTIPDIFKNQPALASIELPGLLTTIIPQQFLNCSALTSFTIPIHVSSIGIGCLEGCTSITKLVTSSAATTNGLGYFGSYFKTPDEGSSIVINWNSYVPTALKEVEIYNYGWLDTHFQGCSKIEKLKLTTPLTYNNYSTTVNAFNGMTSLHELEFFGLANKFGTTYTIQNTFEAILGNATPTKVTMTSEYPFGNRDNDGGTTGFFGTKYFTELYLPNAVVIPSKVGFPGSLTKFEMPKVEEICANAFLNRNFYDCENFTIPITCNTIGDYAFQDFSARKIIYPGTKTQFLNSINRSSTAFYHANVSTIECSDGDISIRYSDGQLT